MNTDLPFALTLPSDLRVLSVARAFVEAVCQTGNLDRSTIHAVVLATGEAVSNVIRHAHRERSGAKLQLCCRLSPDTVEVLVVDEGEPFLLENVPFLDPGEMRVGGRGVFLMRTLMDELTCQGRIEGGNILRMVKRIPPFSPVAECG